jgi:hypothetical protein
MPQILVTTNSHDDTRTDVLLQERINLPDLESDHFSGQLLERLGWALLDADDVEHRDVDHRGEHPRSDAPPRGLVPAG